MPTWTGRIDSHTPERIHQHICLETPESLSKKFALLGFVCDEGVRRNQGRIGAKDGPLALRKALSNLAWTSGKECSLADVGDVTCVEGDLEGACLRLKEAVASILEHQGTPIVLGGGHETAWGHFLGIWEGIHKSRGCAWDEARIGIINFDAHFDLRPLMDGTQATSGTPFLQIANFLKSKKVNFDYTVIGIQETANTKSLFDTAKQLNVSYALASQIHKHGTSKASELIAASLGRNDFIYVSLCLDVFAESSAPGVSAPQPLGLLPSQVLGLWQQIFTSGKVVSCDVVELAPSHDLTGATARLGAQMILQGLF